MLKITLALFLMAHGLVHAGLAVSPNPADATSTPGVFFTAVDRSWLLAKLGVTETAVFQTGILLVILSTIGFVLTGLGIWGVVGLSIIWRILAFISASTSLLLLVLFWHPWLPVGVLINIGVLAMLLWTRWSPR